MEKILPFLAHIPEDAFTPDDLMANIGQVSESRRIEVCVGFDTDCMCIVSIVSMSVLHVVMHSIQIYLLNNMLLNRLKYRRNVTNL
jgi:hypothetical protein